MECFFIKHTVFLSILQKRKGKAEKKVKAGVGRQGRTALVKPGVYFMVWAKTDNLVVI